ncbi:MAG: signal peptidase I [Vicinamibacterales bacterium]
MYHFVFGRSPIRTLVRAALASALLIGGSRVVLTPLRATGISMAPTYRDGELLLVNRLAYLRHPPGRGDVVALRLGGGGAALVKRVIALPGERVRIDRGAVFVDGLGLDEPYVIQRAPWDVAEVTIQPGQVFVIGDNRGMPARLHDFGVASTDRLMGRLVY